MKYKSEVVRVGYRDYMVVFEDDQGSIEIHISDWEKWSDEKWCRLERLLATRDNAVQAAFKEDLNCAFDFFEDDPENDTIAEFFTKALKRSSEWGVLVKDWDLIIEAMPEYAEDKRWSGEILKAVDSSDWLTVERRRMWRKVIDGEFPLKRAKKRGKMSHSFSGRPIVILEDAQGSINININVWESWSFEKWERLERMLMIQDKDIIAAFHEDYKYAKQSQQMSFRKKTLRRTELWEEVFTYEDSVLEN